MGIVPYNNFLSNDWKKGSPRSDVPFSLVLDAIDTVCQLTGSAAHVGIGTDFDGGFGVENIPAGMNSITDLWRIGEGLRERGYAEADIEAITGRQYAAQTQAVASLMIGIAQFGIALAALGIVLALMGLFPGVTGIQPAVGVGVVQFVAILIGFTLLDLGALIYVKFTFYVGASGESRPADRRSAHADRAGAGGSDRHGGFSRLWIARAHRDHRCLLRAVAGARLAGEPVDFGAWRDDLRSDGQSAQ